jgi:hypothetical protein
MKYITERMSLCLSMVECKGPSIVLCCYSRVDEDHLVCKAGGSEWEFVFFCKPLIMSTNNPKVRSTLVRAPIHLKIASLKRIFGFVRNHLVASSWTQHIIQNDLMEKLVCCYGAWKVQCPGELLQPEQTQETETQHDQFEHSHLCVQQRSVGSTKHVSMIIRN